MRAMADTTEAVAWAQSDNRRMLHAVYRVGDLDATVDFYTNCLGMQVCARTSIQLSCNQQVL